MASGLQLLQDFASRVADTASSTFLADPSSSCAALKDSLHIPNTTILDAIYYSNPANVSVLGTCDTSALVEVPLCRLQFTVDTSNSSKITAEAWLPTDWNGRFLAIGNGGLGGCIDYADLDYGSKLKFATVGSNNGHDGDQGKDFVNPEILADFTSRAIHTETVVGKQLVQQYYGKDQDKSYYLGCSTGGRQGTYAALHYPEDFDGILAGAPSTEWSDILGRLGLLSIYTGAPDGNSSERYIAPDLWDVIAAETLNQCDELDGVKDGVITEPDDCDFKPEVLLCSSSRSENCLTEVQVDALRKVYSPLYGKKNELLYPRYDPGAEGGPYAKTWVFGGTPFAFTFDWWTYVVYKNQDFDFSKFNVDDIYKSKELNPGGIETSSGDMSAFKARGGKFITYHGRRDDLIASGHSKRFYEHIRSTMKLPNLDSFYRFFQVPGMGHCATGVGAVNFGQVNLAYVSDDPQKNALLALVDWVENGRAPETLTGVSDDRTQERLLCRYPQKSVFDGEKYVCRE